MQLPTISTTPSFSPLDFKWLLMGPPGIGKSMFLASIHKHFVDQDELGLLIIDPESNKALPGLVQSVSNWKDCKEVLSLLKKEDRPPYSGVALDNLNMQYDFASVEVCKQLNIKHPSDLEHGKGWNRVTQEFALWVRDIINVGLPTFATCHTNIVELKIRGNIFNRYIPSFTGGGANSVYQKMLQSFDIIGFMTFDTKAAVEPPKDVRKDLPPTVSTKPSETIEEVRVIYFQPSQYWEAEDTSRQLPAKVVLPSEWEGDWSEVLKVWGGDK